MVRQVIKKNISKIIVCSLILCNVCTNKVISASGTATGMIFAATGMTSTATYKASEKFIQGKDISFVDATTDIANVGYAGYIIGNIVSIGATILNEYTGIIDKGINYFDNLDKNSNLSTSMNIANSNSTIQGCEKAEVNNNASSSNNSVYANKGYNPKPGERTFKGYVEQNVDSNAELSLYTDSNQFSNTSKNLPIEGGAFKRFGVDEHAGIFPHVHYETYRNIDPNNSNIIRGGLKDNPVRYPNAKDVKQLYDYLENGKYHK